MSKEEVKALLNAPKNLGHRAILATLYGAGLRVSELINLKVRDLDRDRKVIWVRGGKGHKDCQVMLSDTLRDVLAAYWLWKRPTEWLFQAEKPDVPLRADLFSEFAEKQHGGPALPNPCIRIPCGTHLPRTCWTTGSICSLSKRCWAMPT